MTKTELEGNKRDCEKQIQDLRQKNGRQVDDMTEELKALRDIGEGTASKERIRVLKRDLDDALRKLADAEKQLGETRKERDQLKVARTTAHFEQTKLADQGELTRQSCGYELERIAAKLRGTEEDLSKEVEKGTEKQQRIEQLQYELDTMRKKLGETELELTSSKRRVAEMDEIIKNREAEINTHIKKSHENEKETYLLEHEEKGRMQKEIDRLEACMMQVNEENKIEKQNLTQQLQAAEKDKKTYQDEIKSLRKRLAEMQSANEALKTNYIKALDNCDLLEKELKKLQEKHRNLMESEHALLATKDQLELSLRTLTAEQQKLAEEKAAWTKERRDLQSQLVDLTQRYDKTTKDAADQLKTYKAKSKEYKGKVRQANLKLHNMATKLAKMQAENVPMMQMMGKPSQTMPASMPLGEVVPELRQVGAEIAQTLDYHKKIAERMGL